MPESRRIRSPQGVSSACRVGAAIGGPYELVGFERSDVVPRCAPDLRGDDRHRDPERDGRVGSAPQPAHDPCPRRHAGMDHAGGGRGGDGDVRRRPSRARVGAVAGRGRDRRHRALCRRLRPHHGHPAAHDRCADAGGDRLGPGVGVGALRAVRPLHGPARPGSVTRFAHDRGGARGDTRAVHRPRRGAGAELEHGGGDRRGASAGDARGLPGPRGSRHRPLACWTGPRLGRAGS